MSNRLDSSGVIRPITAPGPVPGGARGVKGRYTYADYLVKGAPHPRPTVSTPRLRKLSPTPEQAVYAEAFRLRNASIYDPSLENSPRLTSPRHPALSPRPPTTSSNGQFLQRPASQQVSVDDDILSNVSTPRTFFEKEAFEEKERERERSNGRTIPPLFPDGRPVTAPEGMYRGNDMVRRYFFPDLNNLQNPNAANAPFAKHYDVILPSTISATDTIVENKRRHLTWYYMDYMRRSGFHYGENVESSSLDSLELLKLRDWVATLQPRTKLDAMPLFSLLQSLLLGFLNDQIALKMQEIHKVHRECKAIQRSLSDAEDKAEKIAESLVSAEERAQTAEARVKELEAALAEAKLQYTHTDNELHTTKKKLKVTEEQFHTTRNKLNQEVCRLHDKIKVLQDEVAEWKISGEMSFNKNRDEAVRLIHAHGTRVLKLGLEREGFRLTEEDDTSSDVAAESDSEKKHLDRTTEEKARNKTVQPSTTLRPLTLPSGYWCDMDDSDLEELLRLTCVYVSKLTKATDVYVAEIADGHPMIYKEDGKAVPAVSSTEDTSSAPRHARFLASLNNLMAKSGRDFLSQQEGISWNPVTDLVSLHVSEVSQQKRTKYFSPSTYARIMNDQASGSYVCVPIMYNDGVEIKCLGYIAADSIVSTTDRKDKDRPAAPTSSSDHAAWGGADLFEENVMSENDVAFIERLAQHLAVVFEARRRGRIHSTAEAENLDDDLMSAEPAEDDENASMELHYTKEIHRGKQQLQNILKKLVDLGPKTIDEIKKYRHPPHVVLVVSRAMMVFINSISPSEAFAVDWNDLRRAFTGMSAQELYGDLTSLDPCSKGEIKNRNKYRTLSKLMQEISEEKAEQASTPLVLLYTFLTTAVQTRKASINCFTERKKEDQCSKILVTHENRLYSQYTCNVYFYLASASGFLPF
eukprot:Rmarinus@m.12511